MRLPQRPLRHGAAWRGRGAAGCTRASDVWRAFRGCASEAGAAAPLQDVDSKCDVLLDGQPLQKGQRAVVKPGAVIAMGQVGCVAARAGHGGCHQRLTLSSQCRPASHYANKPPPALLQEAHYQVHRNVFAHA